MLEFQADGTRRAVELKILNLQPGVGAGPQLVWTQVKQNNFDIYPVIFCVFSTNFLFGNAFLLF